MQKLSQRGERSRRTVRRVVSRYNKGKKWVSQGHSQSLKILESKKVTLSRLVVLDIMSARVW